MWHDGGEPPKLEGDNLEDRTKPSISKQVDLNQEIDLLAVLGYEQEKLDNMKPVDDTMLSYQKQVLNPFME